jgi:hypothetical protein
VTVAVATDAASEAATATDITICFIFTPQKLTFKLINIPYLS